ncbi:MAG: SGNH/GDSL hydrolase family protein [Verrucomicrobia subdivision 3 bacterium]|nr:SGNH/GDSL hydrolase family protein [Limisphaerales bacterium]
MKSPNAKLFLTFLATVGLAARVLAADFFIHDGDRVVFLGDSITEQRLYTTYIEAYALTRYPQWQLTFRNVGWGGDTAWLRQRAHPDEKQLFAAEPAAQQAMVEEAVGRGLSRDVLPLKPTAVTIDFGMNDHAYQPFREDIFRAYVRSQTEIAKVLKANGVRVALLTPQPIEDKRPDPDQDVRNQSLRKFSDGLKEVATQAGTTFGDQFDPYMAIMLRARAEDPKAFIGGGDAVHPGAMGHTIMAWAILKALGAPALVSRAEINGATKLVVAAACKIQNLKVVNGVISFVRLDDALPMPIDPACAPPKTNSAPEGFDGSLSMPIDPTANPVLKLAPIFDDLNRYELQITDLAPGSYELSIDGESVGKVTAEQLGKGWNLAASAGPITRQSQELLKLVFQKNNLYFNRWRNVQLYSFPAWAQSPDNETRRTAELARLDQKIVENEAEIEKLRKPQAHQFELKPVAQ